MAVSYIQIVEYQGWKGLWAGNGINMLRIVPTQAIELVTFECMKRIMTSLQENWNQTERPQLQIGHVSLSFSLSRLSPFAVASAAAGIVSTLIDCQPRIYPSLSIAIRKIYKDDGIGAVYSGISPTLIGMLPYSTCYYFMYETMKNSNCLAKKKKSLSRAEMLSLGALFGVTASTISYPLKVARKRLMVGALQGKCPPHMAAALSEVVKQEGLGH
ncbi:probable mitochondrial adenine nucleotide transporter BTL1 isoform X2 [Olea europaea subsp. europaea]|uniref:Probable mitochondrial adenine nucleotide transporter BTL1 isoform X2 n=1 Tax=Olea europaea subsp. europaea TaxID=158383 RepID=A0A8S0QG96_OLEEU|nr:probable mitochondrial adenine nucleotide transporter BTL1 isoform X2 [Olea europaea subsp. europaea]